MRPAELRATSESLHIDWADGQTVSLPAATLRAAARDAASLRERHDTGNIRVFPDLQITGVDHVGAYGLNIRFSDGHEKAIFPFVYLRELGETETS